MRRLEGRLGKLGAKAGSGGAPFLVLVEDTDGTRRDAMTGEEVVPPPGARVIVFTTRPDGPQ